MEKYEVNKETLAVIGLEEGKTKIIEYDMEKILDEKSYQVMDYSCGYFGSSYQGRVDGSKSILGSNYKVPVIVEESSEMIFFPTTSPSSTECTWISLNAVEKIFDEDNTTKVILKNDIILETNVSKSSLENQLLRATRLKYLLNMRKETKK